MDDSYLEVYRKYLEEVGLEPHPSENKLRDVEEKYANAGHIFSFNKEILCSFDVCSGCEGHAILWAMKNNVAKDIDSAPSLREINHTAIRDNPNFQRCPIYF